MLVPSLSAVCRGNLQRRRYRAGRPLEVLDPRSPSFFGTARLSSPVLLNRCPLRFEKQIRATCIRCSVNARVPESRRFVNTRESLFTDLFNYLFKNKITNSTFNI